MSDGKDRLQAALKNYAVVDMGHGTPCWVYNSRSREYASINLGRGEYRPAHTVFYEAHVGPIPKGLEPDHLCRIKRCVNPAHIEPVTHSVNMKRAVPYRKYRKRVVRPATFTFALSPQDVALRNALATRLGVLRPGVMRMALLRLAEAEKITLETQKERPIPKD